MSERDYNLKITGVSSPQRSCVKSAHEIKRDTSNYGSNFKYPDPNSLLAHHELKRKRNEPLSTSLDGFVLTVEANQYNTNPEDFLSNCINYLNESDSNLHDTFDYTSVSNDDLFLITNGPRSTIKKPVLAIEKIGNNTYEIVPVAKQGEDALTHLAKYHK